ncbi:FkbM family methyltransferase [Stieleria sp. JC731]|uniref:FkbM family methyltransferase n=1 Tax=Pirellulaceae TaxID=2691357 RepID=UPI001E58734F|nr:FkbM family methyltransferase [Stieleria sp. JC731]MCC9599037.1 FkbM family methyltransferase [Stieleria sp. JC731]
MAKRTFRQRVVSILRPVYEKIAMPLCHRLGLRAINSVALDYLDIRLIDIFDRKRNGTFIEAGANNGISQSNTYYLEKVLGWTGLLIEPSPSLAEACRRNRSSSAVFNAALVRDGYPDSHVVLEQAGLMSVVNDGVIDEATIREHVDTGRDVQHLEAEAAIKVTARTLQSILDESNLTHIDFFSLDVEGYELEVLSGIDFTKTNIDWILVEVRQSNEERIDQMLQTHGYRWEHIWKTRVYANKLYRRQ